LPSRSEFKDGLVSSTTPLAYTTACGCAFVVLAGERSGQAAKTHSQEKHESTVWQHSLDGPGLECESMKSSGG